MNFLDILSERLGELGVAFVEHLPNIGLALAVLLVTWGVAKIVDRVLERTLGRSDSRRSLKLAIRKLAAIGTWLLGILAAAMVAFPSVTPGKLLGALGLGSVAIGFAFKDIFENFIAGLLILLREPFKLGDYVECEGVSGFVEEITIRDTRIRQVDDEEVTLPNAMLFKNPVNIQTAQDLRRLMILCGVAYDEDVAESREVISRAVSACETVNKDKEIQVFAREFGASSIDFEIAWWTKSDPLSGRRSKDEVVEAVKSALDEAGIEIPFPYRTLTFKDPLSVSEEREQESEAA